MKVVVFGATGGVGRHLVAQALEAGHAVTVLVRRPGVFTAQHQGLRVLLGDVRDPVCVDEAVIGQDAVLSALGPNERGVVSLCADTMQHMLLAMQRHAVRRILVVSAYGAADSHHRNLYNFTLWRLKKEKMLDKERMEALLRQSDVDWTIVRPPMLTDGPCTRHYRTGADLPIHITSYISRADIADFMVRQIAGTQYVHQAPAIVAR